MRFHSAHEVTICNIGYVKPSKASLQRQMTRRKIGAALPEAHIKQMCLNMLPTGVSEKLRERKDLNTLQSHIDEVDAYFGKLNNSELPRIHAQRMSNALKYASRSSIKAVVEEPQEPEQVSSNHTNAGNVEIGQKLDT